MEMRSVIETKRDGGAHEPEELAAIVQGTVDGSIPAYQLAAWLMAVVWRGMTPRETADLTMAMARSGRVLDLSEVPGPIVDKHSTGGVGDKVTLVAGPLAAATGLTVAKMSGRGLGHTGGTLDKLESIPGLTVALDPQRFRAQARRIGLVIAGQTQDLAPADKQLYALRDVTGTVPSPPLIAASIMSKKIAAGAHGIALDVKVGSGAFLRSVDEARALARSMVLLGEAAGLRVAAALTSMDQPLGRAVGNALEVREAIGVLRGDGPPDVREAGMLLAGLMHVVGGTARRLEDVRDVLEAALASGTALGKLVAMVEAQGGDPNVATDPSRLPRARVRLDVPAASDGFVARIDAHAIGQAVVDLGGGRRRMGEAIDPSVGIELRAKVGDAVRAAEPLVTVHARSVEAAASGARRVRDAIDLRPEPTPAPPLLHALLV